LDLKWLYSRHSATYFNQLRCILLPNQKINRLPGNITIICAQTSKSLTRDLLHYHTIWDICSSSPAHHSLERSSSYHIHCILHHDSSCYSIILSSHPPRHFHGIVITFRLPFHYNRIIGFRTMQTNTTIIIRLNLPVLHAATRHQQHANIHHIGQMQCAHLGDNIIIYNDDSIQP